MKVRAKGLASIIGLVGLCIGLPAFGQTEVSVTFTGGYSTTWGNLSGNYGAGIYSATINGASSPGIICDDFNDSITTGQNWNAYAYQASSLNSSNIGETLFGNTIGLTGYAEVATLVSMMFSGGSTYGSITGITQAELSSAIWDITLGGTPTSLQGLDSKAKALVAAVEAAFNGNTSKAQAYLATLTSLWILTPTPLGPNQPQEMWTQGLQVAEGGAALMYLLLAGISCFGAMILSHRNQSVRRETA